MVRPSREEPLLNKLAIAAVFTLALGASAHAASKVSWEFVVDAGRLSVEGSTISLRDVSSQAVAFSDRPYRMARHVPVKTLVSLWGRPDISRDPPNAGITATVGGKLANAVVKLTNPRFVGNSLKFDSKLLEGSLPIGGSDVVLFIDAFPTAVNDQITD